MSRENVEVVQAAFDAYSRADLDRLLEVTSPEIVVNQPQEQPDLQTYEGHDGLMRALAEWVGEWDGYQVEVLRVIDADPHVMAKVRQRGRGKASGVEIESTMSWVFTMEGSKIVRWRMFLSEQEALEAVGLRE